MGVTERYLALCDAVTQPYAASAASVSGAGAG